MSIDDEIARIKTLRDKAHIAKIRAEATIESAQANYDLAMKELTARYGVDSPETVRAKLAELQRDLEVKMAQVSAILDNNS